MELVATAVPRRIRVAQLLAFVALAAALLGALGPAERVRTTYSWPPSELPAETPDRLWYTPLLLSMHRPEMLATNLPCSLPAPLPDAQSPTVVIATARNPERVDGLSVVQVGDVLELRLGSRLLDRIDVSRESRTGQDCAYRLDVSSVQWSLRGGPRGIERGGPLDAAPMVTGLFSALDLRSPRAPSVEVTTAVHATRVTALQALAWIVAALAGVGALLLVSFARAPSIAASTRSAVATARRHASAPDAVVALVLAGWWVISPAYIDDGYTVARHTAFDESRGFSYYYSAFGANLPLDYWVDWAQHWLTEASASLVVQRVPALVCLAVAWLLCRVVAARILGDSLRGAPAWTLASAFVVGALAWGMTLRPEPVTAVFVTAVAACMLLFVERPSTGPVAAAGALVALSLSAHPAGIVSLAALVAAAPQLVRWIRPNAAAATAIVASSLALLGTLLFVGSDLEQRRLDAQLSRTYAFSQTWRDEVTRYALLSEHHYGTPLRRASVALIALALLAFVLRRRRSQTTAPFLDFPSLTLASGTLLLAATPSKWPSHFGTLLGVAAIAAACETARAREEGRRSTAWQLWPFGAVAAAIVVVSWAWLEREDWNIVDLRTLDWTPAFPIAWVAALLPLAALGAALLLVRPRSRAPWRIAALTAPLVAAPVIAFTSGTLLTDLAKTDGWTLTRQNLDTLAARDLACGLGEDLIVPVTESARALRVHGSGTRAAAAWIPPPPVAGLPRYPLGPSNGSRLASPWFELRSDPRLGLFVSGATGDSNRLLVEWGRAQGDRVRSLSVDRLDATRGPLSGNSSWRFFTASDLPERHPRADVIRVVHAIDVPPGGALAVTAPASYAVEPLAVRLRGQPDFSLLMPHVLTYFPCARLPSLRAGAVAVPGTIVAWENGISPIQFPQTSPFAGVLDLYRLTPLSLADSDDPPAGVFAYEVDREIPGAEIARPDAITSS